MLRKSLPIKCLLVFSFMALCSASYGGASDELAQAEQLHKQAISLQGGWISTQKYIKETKAALKAGKKSQADRAASQALKHARRSLAQAQEQRQQWQEPAYLKTP